MQAELISLWVLHDRKVLTGLVIYGADVSGALGDEASDLTVDHVAPLARAQKPPRASGSAQSIVT